MCEIAPVYGHFSRCNVRRGNKTCEPLRSKALPLTRRRELIGVIASNHTRQAEVIAPMAIQFKTHTSVEVLVVYRHWHLGISIDSQELKGRNWTTSSLTSQISRDFRKSIVNNTSFAFERIGRTSACWQVNYQRRLPGDKMSEIFAICQLGAEIATGTTMGRTPEKITNFCDYQAQW